MTAEKISLTASPIRDQLEELHRKFANIGEGALAGHIRELAEANPNWFGICIVTTNGGIYEVGDSRQEFTVQSISKPFVYGLALEDHGRTEVLKKVGVEPTSDALNSISLDPETGTPRNPMSQLDVQDKARKLTRELLSERQLERLVDSVTNLEKINDTSIIGAALP